MLLPQCRNVLICGRHAGPRVHTISHSSGVRAKIRDLLTLWRVFIVCSVNGNLSRSELLRGKGRGDGGWASLLALSRMMILYISVCSPGGWYNVEETAHSLANSRPELMMMDDVGAMLRCAWFEAERMLLLPHLRTSPVWRSSCCPDNKEGRRVGHQTAFGPLDHLSVASTVAFARHPPKLGMHCRVVPVDPCKCVLQAHVSIATQEQKKGVLQLAIGKCPNKK